ncbi:MULTISPECIES: hypothetical protein [Kitasatospora]|uniref:Secreted protein n=1 Tax=Kitasatospora setae (strain ATCC 33774 / DSM 43861 / JCM 3304 / KCC A-0304 / NBRC 14216 / KM-6054) TaxID=452652 RepID=E4N2U7_KITSK|nr:MULTISPECIES: hypothetical protein [Kitasatospora]BAJ32481.1 hypothetical protein KSE_67230 [Kitasatospora setae KM-6054]
MSSGLVVAVVVIAVVVAAALGAFAVRQRQRHPSLSRRFGSEYGRTVARHGGDTAAAERELAQRVARHRELTLSPLSDAERARAEEQWAGVKARFVDDPRQALADAEALLSRVARDRGYPDSDVDAQIDTVSVDHGEHVESFRELSALSRKDDADTEVRRAALARARELFTALVGTGTVPEPAPAPARGRGPAEAPAGRLSKRREHQQHA